MMKCEVCKANYNEDQMTSLDYTDKDICTDCFKSEILEMSTSSILEIDVEKDQDWSRGTTTLIFPFGKLIVDGYGAEWEK